MRPASTAAMMSSTRYTAAATATLFRRKRFQKLTWPGKVSCVASDAGVQTPSVPRSISVTLSSGRSSPLRGQRVDVGVVGVPSRSSHSTRTFGLRIAYEMSTTRFTRTVRIAMNNTEAWIAGRSFCCTAVST